MTNTKHILPHTLVLAAYRTEADKIIAEVEEWDKKVPFFSKSAQEIWERHRHQIKYKIDEFNEDYLWLLSTPQDTDNIWTSRRRRLSSSILDLKSAADVGIGLIRDEKSTK